MKSLMLLMQTLLEELGSYLSARTLHDWNTIVHRVETEGFSFLTITLPGFHDEFLLSLDQGFVAPSAFPAFKRGKGGCLPAFLQGFTEQVFDSNSGELLTYPNPEAVRAVRQVCLFYSKIQIPCSDARVRKAISGYIECEKEVRMANTKLTDHDYDRFRAWFHRLFGPILFEVDREIENLVYSDEIRPGHGPGATADRLKGNQKWLQKQWTRRLEKVLPAGDMLLPNWRHYRLLEDVDFLEPWEERPVRIVTVPKTLKSPRIIAIEPTAMQYAQQALANMLVSRLESARNPNSAMIGFTDQTPNQLLARMGSFHKDLATLDLSEASDRVSNQLVVEAFRDWPTLSEAIQATRSLRADVPGFGVIPLAKYASMGSALTFPIEAMIFLTLIMIGIEDALVSSESGSHLRVVGKHYPDRLRASDVLEIERASVRVYGDDIICPTYSAPSVARTLEAYGFKVNSRKSFWTGWFRESCGKEYFDGHDVSIVKCRRELPQSRRDAAECVSASSLRNQLYESGLWRTAAVLDDLLTKVFKGFYPVVEPTSAVLGRHSFLPYREERMDSDWHSPLVKGYVVQSTLPKNPLDGEAALLKWLLKKSPEPFDDDHLERSGRPDAVRLKLRWASPF